MTANDELLPCPWCGIAPQVKAIPLVTGDRLRIYCDQPLCCHAEQEARTADAIARWNTRHQPDDQLPSGEVQSTSAEQSAQVRRLVEAVQKSLGAISTYPNREHPLTASEIALRFALAPFTQQKPPLSQSE